MGNSTDLEVRRTIKATNRYASRWDTAASGFALLLGWEIPELPFG